MVNNSISDKVNEDLKKERIKCLFNTEELTQFLDGGAKYTSDRRIFENKILSHKELFEGVPEEYLSHKERYEAAIRKAVIYTRLVQKYSNNDKKSGLEKNRSNFSNLTANAVFRDSSPLGLHYSMFIPTLMGQGTQEQQDYWLKRAQNWEIIGTYAQTELGHGTFVRGLETTATYDPQTDEFVLHSPTLTAYKWWPGSLAHTANYCVVMANLIIKGKSHGIQPFLVQIRDEKSHMPLPGVKLGEIGAKLAYNNVNNGFLGFEQHRIARDMMLMKYSKVLKGGTFVGSPGSKLAYGTMIFVRVMIVSSAATNIAKAATIAVRYSAVRHQSQPKPNEPEPQILDYVTQQHKIFIAVASSYAFHLTAKWIWDIYEETLTEMATGNMERLPELHALSCGLKAVSTSDACTFIERCRTSCGGHGFMQSSNLPYTYGLAAAAYTYEGEFTVLMLQSARSLVKAWNAAVKGQPLSPTLSYLMDNRSQPKWVNSVDGIIAGFRRVAVGKVAAVVDNINKLVRRGVSYEDAWNQSSVRSVAAAEAHCRYIILSTFNAELQRAPLSAPLKTALAQLVHMYANYWALEKIGDLLLYTSISEIDVHELQSQYEGLLEKIRPNAVGLVDAFDFRDEILHSTLGSYDGRVYERLMEEALKSPLNKEPVNQSFHTHLKPFMQGKL